MGEKKVTIMVLEVDLQCEKCYRKVKKVLCKFPQIRDQTYDEKNNQVIIKVVCCSPEKIRDKICCKGDGAIKSIEIKEPLKPQPPPDKKHPPPPNKKAPPPPDKNPPPPPNKNPPPPPDKNPPPSYLPPCPGNPPRRVNTCCTECYGGHPGGPCETGYGYGGAALVPVPYIQYDGYCGRPVYDSYGGGRSYATSYCLTRPDCFSEENPQACAIM